jgi:hypothetical protein
MANPPQNGARKRAGHIIWLGWMILLIGAAWLLPAARFPNKATPCGKRACAR